MIQNGAPKIVGLTFEYRPIYVMQTQIIGVDTNFTILNYHEQGINHKYPSQSHYKPHKQGINHKYPSQSYYKPSFLGNFSFKKLLGAGLAASATAGTAETATFTWMEQEEVDIFEDGGLTL